jgi:hypothetical protein
MKLNLGRQPVDHSSLSAARHAEGIPVVAGKTEKDEPIMVRTAGYVLPVDENSPVLTEDDLRVPTFQLGGCPSNPLPN